MAYQIVMQFHGHRMSLADFLRVNIDLQCYNGAGWYGDHPVLRNRNAVYEYVKAKFYNDGMYRMMHEYYYGGYNMLDRGRDLHVCCKIFCQIAEIVVHYVRVFIDASCDAGGGEGPRHPQASGHNNVSGRRK